MNIEIVQGRDTGEVLAADKDINFPDSHLVLPALSEKDMVDPANRRGNSRSGGHVFCAGASRNSYAAQRTP